MGFPERAMDVRRSAGSMLIETFFNTATRLGRLHPSHRDTSVERLGDLPYREGSGAAHRLDVYRPRERSGPLPVVIYIHGGSFRVLSKDSHWVMGVQFAKAGHICFNLNYRLAPKNPFPAALEDVADALQWVVEHAALYGGDPSQLMIAGESAGANLTCALTAAACMDLDHPVAERVRALDVVPQVILPACGILEVTRPERFETDPRVKSWLVMDRIRNVSRSYTPEWSPGGDSIPLADPLVLLEGDTPLLRPWPATFVGCGDVDPIADDSERLAKALWRRNATAELVWYADQPHAFQMLIWRDEAKQFWSDSFRFISEHNTGAQASEFASEGS
ncbi:MAG: alpha/beta hydrolase [Myxococcota bacterium]